MTSGEIWQLAIDLLLLVIGGLAIISVFFMKD